MVQLKIQTNFVNLKFNIAGPSLSDCLETNLELKSGLAIKGTVNNVSLKAENCFNVKHGEKIQSFLIKLKIWRIFRQVFFVFHVGISKFSSDFH